MPENSEFLSRLPDKTEQHDEIKQQQVLMIEISSSQIANAKAIAKQTEKDPFFLKISAGR